MRSSTLQSILGFTLGLALILPAAVHGQNAAREGISVHGAWTIEVRNPDGTLVERREFTNAFVAPGLLARGLAGENTVVVDGIAMDTECGMNTGSVGLGCGVLITATVPTSGADADALVLDGSATIQLTSGTTDQITEVASVAYPCAATDSATECNRDRALPLGGAPVAFTSTTLAQPVDVADGQTVTVRVVITFN